MTLEELSVKYGSDKGSIKHNYCKWYEKYLPKDTKSILEIGCMHGASLRMWRDYFHGALVATADLFQNEEFASKEQIESEGFKAYKIDQGYTEQLATINEKYEIILDDGSHRADHQIISLKYLFKNNLKSKGLYIVEDLDCNREAFFRHGLSFRETILWHAEHGILHRLIDETFYAYKLHDNKILFIWKK